MNFKTGDEVIVVSNDKSGLSKSLLNIRLKITDIDRETGRIWLNTHTIFSKQLGKNWSKGFVYYNEIIPVTKLYKVLE